MKKVFSINIKTFLLKVLIIFLIGFAFRIIIHDYLGINVLLDYTNNISILYYLSLLLLTVYIDQIFSFNLYIPVDSINITSFKDDYKITNLLFTKDYRNGSSSPSSTDHSSGCSKTNRKSVTINSKYIYLRPAINGKGDMILVTGLNIGKHGSFNMPPTPKPSNLSTPSTMSPLFPTSSESVPLNELDFYRSPKSSNLSHELPKRYTLDSIDFADRRRKVIESAEQKIKESNINKPTKKPCVLSKVSYSLSCGDSHRTPKLIKEPRGNTDIISQEMAEKKKRKERDLERRAFYTMLSWKK